jgi:ligand-binding SRPBCC domain-containing protein
VGVRHQQKPTVVLWIVNLNEVKDLRNWPGSAGILRPANGAVLRMTKAEDLELPHHLEFEQWVPFPLERVFAFFSNPENLPRIMPASSGTKLSALNRKPAPPPPPGIPGDKAAGVGSTIVTSFRVFPFLPARARWIARITEFERNRYFADVLDKGPFKSWHHRHEFHVETRGGIAGTLVRDVIDYEVGFGFLGTIADAFFVRRQMQSTFAQRQQTLRNLLA